MMNVKEGYRHWSAQYDSNENKTRDLEAHAIRHILQGQAFEYCLEIGCGTGKNTEFLVNVADKILAIDLSIEMLSIAKEKIPSSKVSFTEVDINQEWDFAGNHTFDLATFSLVLEHIENLDFIFEALSKVIRIGGTVYIGEFHPFKQYCGSKARFENEKGIQILTCFNHHMSDFVQAAKKHGFQLTEIDEYFDDDQALPRILTMVFQKS